MADAAVSRLHIAGRTLAWAMSSREHGDLRPDGPDAARAAARRGRFIDVPCTLLDQRHGIDVVEVGGPGEGHMAPGDILVTSQPGVAVGIWAGDCVPLLLASASGHLVMAHVGWRGLARGAVAAAVARVRAAGPDPVIARFGPHIGPCCYAFGAADLAAVAAALGVPIAAISRPVGSALHGPDHPGGPPRALDMGAAVVGELRRCGVQEIAAVPSEPAACTGCDRRWFSWRRRSETERHVLAAWWES